eukprot:3177680-Karenia_brevis.AAC.1
MRKQRSILQQDVLLARNLLGSVTVKCRTVWDHAHKLDDALAHAFGFVQKYIKPTRASCQLTTCLLYTSDAADDM